VIAILIHYLGFYVVNALIPGWAVEVDGELASLWYLSFVCIDVMALSITRHALIKSTLAASCAWSLAVGVETWFLHDSLQSVDFVAQYLIDGMLGALLAIQVVFYVKDWHRFRFGHRRA